MRSTGTVLALGSRFGRGEGSYCDATQEPGWLWGKLASLEWVGPLSPMAHNSHRPQALKLWVDIGLGQGLGSCVSKVIRTPNQCFSGEILADFHLPRGQLLLFTENLLPEACPGSLGSQQTSLQSKLSRIKENLSHGCSRFFPLFEFWK